MQQASIQILSLWFRADERLRSLAVSARDERGEVTGQTAMIVLLVTGAIAAGVAITAAMQANTSNIPTP
ncbi:MAG: hypothetical protein AB8G26_14420 [Ilumatobacter sp.]